MPKTSRSSRLSHTGSKKTYVWDERDRRVIFPFPLLPRARVAGATISSMPVSCGVRSGSGGTPCAACRSCTSRTAPQAVPVRNSYKPQISQIYTDCSDGCLCESILCPSVSSVAIVPERLMSVLFRVEAHRTVQPHRPLLIKLEQQLVVVHVLADTCLMPKTSRSSRLSHTGSKKTYVWDERDRRVIFPFRLLPRARVDCAVDALVDRLRTEAAVDADRPEDLS